MARVVRFHKVGGPEVLRIEEVEVPPPGKGEVQISSQGAGAEPRRVDVPQRPVPGRPQAARPAGLRGGRDRRRRRSGRAGVQGRRRGQHHPELLAEPVRPLRRPRERPGPRRDPSPRIALLGRGGGGLDAVPHRLRGAHRHRQADEGRHDPDPRGIEQRRPGRHPDRQQGRGGSRRPDARQVEATGPAGRRRGPRHRHRRAGPGEGGPRHHRRQGCPHGVRPRRRPDLQQARAGDGPVGDPVPLRCARARSRPRCRCSTCWASGPRSAAT